jgi:tRNA pseudouridine55 synthase
MTLAALPPYVLLYKPAGPTPLEALEALRRARPEFATVTLGYAGRLDPTAEGLLLVLVGAENQRNAYYLGLEKEYRVEVLLGFATDTYDALGLVTHEAPVDAFSSAALQEVWRGFEGSFVQPFPPFSSRTVRGRPLFYWARHGGLDESERPAKLRTVHRIEVESVTSLERDALGARIEQTVRAVRGNFRQDAIVARWREVLAARPEASFPLVRIRVACSSGTYMRSLAHDAGARLGSCALALGIERTRIGPHALSEALVLPELTTPSAPPTRTPPTPP